MNRKLSDKILNLSCIQIVLWSQFGTAPQRIACLSISSITGFPGEFGSRRNAAHSAFLNLRKNGMKQFAGIISSMMGNMSQIIADQVQTENKIRPHTPAQRVDLQAKYKAFNF
ncbi:MAG: hypothetical protein Ct9H300mP28_07300 [Pseudomonadota bacterium]|nr:MAG: hypothetical protein Ct9H300mP28_07300 [Pseudomonadota bacterium]